MCELYRESDDLGELGERGVHGLDLVFAAAAGAGDISSYVTVPAPVVNALDELKVPHKSFFTSASAVMFNEIFYSRECCTILFVAWGSNL